ncbi:MULTISPECIES: ABC transporter permease [unclassified Oleiphilus]|jgi:phosphonate transport system permease protein|nr:MULTISPECIES: ABC transporter permease [unclassified Oleiphilus]KZY77234.1 ABC transporter permease [Oleiphilus sp. HI0068]KZY78789.1 ABC transporter permease [Oleiphilus sp. HI0069]KZZ20048.1 ABC transporter permease [Oleiphilus sp. HI0078]KZY38864.1 ABC transporter permease [Oleiphilus sp. HI0043]KZY62394.1 ABC transporter permease [Oleiphilus sp. HI0061]
MWTLNRVSSGFLFLALICLCFADLEIITADPWGELGRIAQGFVSPSFFSWYELLVSLLNTLAFALVGVAISSVFGLLLAQCFQHRLVRIGCAFIRSIHEIFWALLFLQFFGLSTLTGLLAIIIPFSGIFAKVYAEILEESDRAPNDALTHQAQGSFSAFLYARLAQAWPQVVSYTRYRLECGIRSSAILGFIGLPTLGFHLESFFSEGEYDQAAAVLYVFFFVIASLRFWSHRRSLLLLLLVAVVWLSTQLNLYLSTQTDLIWRFLSYDILPEPLKGAETLWQLEAWYATWDWASFLIQQQVAEGVWNTLLLTMISLVGSGILALVMYPFISPLFLNKGSRYLSHFLLVVLRSIPELMLVFVLLIMMGPSMVPAIVALSLHNGAIIAHLIGNASRNLKLRQDAPKGINLYSYEVTPRLYRPFLAFLFYRWEVILRESAILGILGVHTLGFYVDSAFEELRFDRALFLILVTALLNILVDTLSRGIRRKLRLNALPDMR